MVMSPRGSRDSLAPALMREEGEASWTESLGPALGTERCREQVAMTAGCEEGAILNLTFHNSRHVVMARIALTV